VPSSARERDDSESCHNASSGLLEDGLMTVFCCVLPSSNKARDDDDGYNIHDDDVEARRQCL